MLSPRRPGVALSLLLSIAACSTQGERTSPKPSPSTPASTSSPAADPVIAAAGDIACDPDRSSFNNGRGTSTACRQADTAALLAKGGYAAILALGDLQYEAPTLDDFQRSYGLSWGKFKAITYPVPGNHEYGARVARGYYQYFGSRAGDPSKGYYSFDIGAWHLVALNANCGAVGGCGSSSPQGKWLRDDLAAHDNRCTLAYWHQPRFSSGLHGDIDATDGFWRVLYAAGADVILVGHDHDYERFAPQTPDGDPDRARGIREFVVGTGGRSTYPFGFARSNSEVRKTGVFGVLALTLRAGSYDWRFVPVAGQTFADSGSTSCH
jgi:calcineurin-like phosphoesterase family protein